MHRFPDTIPANDAQFATFVPFRKPEFKVHRTEGLAHSAMAQRGYGEAYAMYQLIQGFWVKVYEYQPPTDCGDCGNPIGDTKWGFPDYCKPVLRKKWNSPPICRTCYYKQTEERDSRLRDRAQARKNK